MQSAPVITFFNTYFTASRKTLTIYTVIFVVRNSDILN